MRSETIGHLQRARDFLAAAAVLHEAGHFGISIGRAYYAAFHAATAALAERGMSRNSHHGVISAFGEFIVKPGFASRDAHKTLAELFSERGQSDYVFDATASESDSIEAIDRATQFVNEVEAVCRAIQSS